MALNRISKSMMDPDFVEQVDVAKKNTAPVINVFENGVVPEDATKATNNATVMLNFLSQGKNLYIPEGNTYIDDTIIIPINQVVRGAGSKTKVIMTSTTKHAFRIKKKSQLHALEIEVASGSIAAGIYINTSDSVLHAVCKDIKVNGRAQWNSNEQSHGVLIEGATGEAYFNVFETVVFENTTWGIKTNPTGGFVTSNVFNNVFCVNSIHFMDIKGGANRFTNFICQPLNGKTVDSIVCRGDYNVFQGFVYDNHYLMNGIVYEFTSPSYNNEYNDPSDLKRSGMVKDAGARNRALGSEKTFFDAFLGFGYTNGADVDGSNQSFIGFYGMQDNALAYANKRDTATIKSGTVTYGDVSKMFSADGPFDGTKFSDPSVTPIEIEVVLTTSLRNVSHLGILFDKPAKSFEVWTKLTSGATYTKLTTVTNNQNANWQIHPNPVGVSSIAALKIVITEAYTEGTYNTAKEVLIRSIWCNDGLYGGNAFLKKGGGSLYGDVNVTGKVLTTKGISGGTYTPNTRPWFLDIGVSIYDSVLGKPLWLKAKNGDGSGRWVDANGTLAWTQGFAYALNDKVVTNNNVYQATVAGTTGAVMPTHTTGTATDGTVTWAFVKSIV